MEITLKINLPDRAVDFKCLDDILTEELNKSGQAAVQEWVDRIEERQFRHREKGLRKERREARYLRFSLFDVRVKRYKVSRPDSSGRRRYSHLVDELLGIGDGVSPS
ncbi:MAG: hypothetical protein ACE5JA_04905, partial [bacterium]